MSALPPKADIAEHHRHVRLMPKRTYERCLPCRWTIHPISRHKPTASVKLARDRSLLVECAIWTSAAPLTIATIVIVGIGPPWYANATTWALINHQLVRLEAAAVSRVTQPAAMLHLSETISSISSDVTVIGKIICKGVLKIYGLVEGEVIASNALIVDGARIQGDIFAEELTIGGRACRCDQRKRRA